MLLVDTVNGRLISDEEIKEKYALAKPYGEWVDSNLVHLADLKIPNIRVQEYTDEERARLQKAFGIYLRGFQEYHISYGRERCRGNQCHGY